jgi:hypothetical protein
MFAVQKPTHRHCKRTEGQISKNRSNNSTLKLLNDTTLGNNEIIVIDQFSDSDESSVNMKQRKTGASRKEEPKDPPTTVAARDNTCSDSLNHLNRKGRKYQRTGTEARWGANGSIVSIEDRDGNCNRYSPQNRTKTTQIDVEQDSVHQKSNIWGSDPPTGYPRKERKDPPGYLAEQVKGYEKKGVEEVSRSNPTICIVGKEISKSNLSHSKKTSETTETEGLKNIHDKTTLIGEFNENTLENALASDGETWQPCGLDDSFDSADDDTYDDDSSLETPLTLLDSQKIAMTEGTAFEQKISFQTSTIGGGPDYKIGINQSSDSRPTIDSTKDETSKKKQVNDSPGTGDHQKDNSQPDLKSHPTCLAEKHGSSCFKNNSEPTPISEINMILEYIQAATDDVKRKFFDGSLVPAATGGWKRKKGVGDRDIMEPVIKKSMKAIIKDTSQLEIVVRENNPQTNEACKIPKTVNTKNMEKDIGNGNVWSVSSMESSTKEVKEKKKDAIEDRKESIPKFSHVPDAEVDADANADADADADDDDDADADEDADENEDESVYAVNEEKEKDQDNLNKEQDSDKRSEKSNNNDITSLSEEEEGEGEEDQDDFDNGQEPDQSSEKSFSFEILSIYEEEEEGSEKEMAEMEENAHSDQSNDSEAGA